jgi:hypothetical protein
MSTDGGGGINIPVGADLSQFARDLDDLPRDMASKLRAAADKIRAQMARNRLDLKTATTAGDADLVDRLTAANAKLAQGLDAVARSAQVKAQAVRQAAAADLAARDAAAAGRAEAMRTAAANRTAAVQAAQQAAAAQRAAIAASSSSTVDISPAGARMVGMPRGGKGGKTGGGGSKLGYQLMNVGQLLDDLQYVGEMGLRPIMNNLMQINPLLGIAAIAFDRYGRSALQALGGMDQLKKQVGPDSPLGQLIGLLQHAEKLFSQLATEAGGVFKELSKGIGLDFEKLDRAAVVAGARKIEGYRQTEARELADAEHGAIAAAINKAGGGEPVIKMLMDKLTGHGTKPLAPELLKAAEGQYATLLNATQGKDVTPESKAAVEQLKLLMKGTPLAALFERETPAYKADIERIKGEQAERAQSSEAAREETTGAQDRRADEVARGLMDRLGFRLLGPNADEHTTGLARLQLAEELKKSGLDEGVAREVAARAFDKIADALAEKVRTRAATENLSPVAAAGAEQRDVWQRTIDRARGVVEDRRRRLRNDPGEILQGKAPAQSEILGSSELTNRLLTAGFQGKDDVQVQKEILEEARRQTGLQQEQRDAIRTMSDDLHRYSKARLG